MSCRNLLSYKWRYRLLCLHSRLLLRHDGSFQYNCLFGWLLFGCISDSLLELYLWDVRLGLWIHCLHQLPVWTI